MFLTPASQIGALIMAAVCLFAAWTGGRPQRLTAGIVFVAWILSAAIQDRSYNNPQYVTLVLDAFLMVLFVGMALKWRHSWLIWVAAFQTLTTATHVAAILDPRIWAKASITAYMIWSYLLLASLLWGGVAGLLERRRGGGAG